MDEAKRDLVRSWFTRAQHDLASSRKLSADPDPYLDTAIYSGFTNVSSQTRSDPEY